MRILLIEDYEPLRRSVAKGLREEGFAVDTASDGDEGLWYAESHSYDVIVLDLMLPRRDGLSLLKELRRKGGRDPVLVVTAKDTVEDRVHGLDLGADDYLVKPFAFAELVARVRALVRRRYDDADPVIRVRGLVIDTTARRVHRGDVEIELTAREYALLEYLSRRAGEAVSRTDIWTHLYDEHADATSNVVDVYVGYLRRKLDLPGEPSLIKTRRGVGYVFAGDES